MKVKEMGTWLLHCHVNDHMTGGMEGTYTVFNPRSTGMLCRVLVLGVFGFANVVGAFYPLHF